MKLSKEGVRWTDRSFTQRVGLNADGELPPSYQPEPMHYSSADLAGQLQESRICNAALIKSATDERTNLPRQRHWRAPLDH